MPFVHLAIVITGINKVFITLSFSCSVLINNNKMCLIGNACLVNQVRYLKENNNKFHFVPCYKKKTVTAIFL